MGASAHRLGADLRAVEGTIARVDLVVEALGVERGAQRPLGAVPHLIVADPLI